MAKQAQRPRHWPPARDTGFLLRQHQAVLEGWQLELQAGKRPATPQLQAAMAVERALVDRLAWRLEQEAGDPQPQMAGGPVGSPGEGDDPSRPLRVPSGWPDGQP